MGGIVAKCGEISERESEKLILSHTTRGDINRIEGNNFFLTKFNFIGDSFDEPIEINDNCFLVFDGNLFDWKKKDLLNVFRYQNFFKLFDSDLEFCFLLLDKKNNKLILGRDLIGSRPLFYSKNKDGVVVASERHELLSMGFEEINRVSPGNLVKFNLNNLNVKTQKIVDFNRKDKDFRRVSKLKKTFLHKFKKSVEKRTKNIDHAVVAFSGGVDSSLLSKILNEYIDIKLLTVGLKGSNDLMWSEKASKILKLPHEKIEISFEEIKNLIKPTLEVVGEANRLKIGVGLPFNVLSRKVNELGYNVLFSGQGSDELFLGYDKYKRAENPKNKILDDLNRIAKENIERDEAICMENGVEIRNPYLDREIVDFALNLPYEINLPEKRIVREAAKSFLPKEIWRRDKKSVQYGTKIDREIDRIARRNGFKRKIGNHVDKYLSSLAKDIFPKNSLNKVSEYLNH